MKKTVLSAIQPTSKLHLGNYLGAVRQWLPMVKTYQSIFFVVDLHAITVRQDPKELKESTYQAIATYLACGLDPDESTLFLQSHVHEHAELAWVLTCFSNMGELNRMTQFKDKSAKSGKQIPTGIFTYPLLMASDILLYDTHFVPVGADQKQHVELTRDLAMRINNVYGADTFVVPEPMIPDMGARIMSLQNPNQKMSKSDPDPHATIGIFDSDDTILKKLKRAVTDSGSEITWDESKPGIINLLTIQAAILGVHPKSLCDKYAGKQYGHLKIETAELVIGLVKPIRDRAQQLLSDLGYLDQILQKGAQKARPIAQATLSRVYERLGFLSPL